MQDNGMSDDDNGDLQITRMSLMICSWPGGGWSSWGYWQKQRVLRRQAIKNSLLVRTLYKKQQFLKIAPQASMGSMAEAIGRTKLSFHLVGLRQGPASSATAGRRSKAHKKKFNIVGPNIRY
jgi:hypothetical protein